MSKTYISTSLRRLVAERSNDCCESRTTIWLIKLNRNDRIQERRLWLASGLVRLSE